MIVILLKFEPSEINQTSLETNLRFLFRPVKEIKISIDNIFAKLKTDTSAARRNLVLV